MLTITLAYVTDNQTTAHRIAADLASHVSFVHVSVGKSNEGPVLADLLKDTEGPVVVLISSDFLTNSNCMLRGQEIFGSDREVLPVFIRSHAYDELQDEVISTQTSLASQQELMYYVNYWEDRYIKLRKPDDDLGGGEAFVKYKRKIRETSVQMEELLRQIKDGWALTEAQFAADHYHQLFIFAERPKLWEELKDFENAAPMDLSGIPGLEMLGMAGQDDEAQPQVQSEDDEADIPEPTDQPQTNYPMTSDNLDAEAPEITSGITGEPAKQEGTDASAQEMSPAEQANIWIERAWSMHDEGDATSALELLNAGRDALPDHHKLHYHYALLLATSTEDAAAARRETEALLAKHPDHPDALYLNGELYLSAGDYQSARENWEQLSDIEPFYPDLNYRLGILLADHFAEDFLEAAAYLRRATKDKEPNPDAFYRYALLLAGPVGRQGKAIKVLRKGLAIDPSHAYAQYELAVLLHQRGEYEGARIAFKTATAINSAFNTAANRKAFAAISLVTAATPAEEDALAALKQNIASLEAMIAERDRVPEPTPAPAPAPPKGAGKTVLITGATSGIGRATARCLAVEGFRLILIGRRNERLEELGEELLNAHQTETLLIPLDVTDREAVSSLPARLAGAWQNIDVLVNNAGKAKGVDPIHEGQLDHWDEMIDVNLKGLLYLTRAISPVMVERRSGMIINVCSTAGKEVYPNGNVYCATKHAVDALTRAMRIDLVKHGIRVGQICPAMVEETEFSVVRYDGDAERAKIYEDFQPLRSPDVARAIEFMITQPAHVNILDMVIQGTQQASSTLVDRSGRNRFAEEE
ncbi:SDR family NAD(P)-dependent oxidoreductase [Neolewinella aurantiaca]|uniref:SDR family NAD(P)-dependent oxidoreductase n=1 Tax=Neolewinella aurantiaca TaxID=2602767 RepID=A0A5C7FSG3_9BACT|nr:SDR family NAD(P)-dependent oxidoreductase [Neolewinella aurantiaca]TXF88408.1 SDR family NAD(P)-dependent oxidoreductase [Neolewinella aurantiaca]